jgi:hypothetical protein
LGFGSDPAQLAKTRLIAASYPQKTPQQTKRPPSSLEAVFSVWHRWDAGMIWHSGRISEAVQICDICNVAARQADIIQFTIRQFAQSIAGYAGIIPSDNVVGNIAEKANNVVCGDSAEWRGAGGFKSGHFDFPFCKLPIFAALCFTDWQIGVLHVQSNPQKGHD